MESMTATNPPSTEAWRTTTWNAVERGAIIAPALVLLGTIMIVFDVQRLEGDLSWVSHPEGAVGVFAAVFLVATWIAVGRRIATAAHRTGVFVTLAGVAGAIGWSYPFALRVITADYAAGGIDTVAMNDVLVNGGSVWTALVLLPMSMSLIVPFVAGVAILRTRVAPAWAGLGFIAFAVLIVVSQGAYVALEVTYPLAALSLLAAVAGTLKPPA